MPGGEGSSAVENSASCGCGSGLAWLDCCAPWEAGAGDAELQAVAARLALDVEAVRAMVTEAEDCISLAPRIAHAALPPMEAARQVRRAWLLVGRAPDEPHLVAATVAAELAEVEENSSEEADYLRVFAAHASWARLVAAAPPPVLKALYGDVLHVVSERLLAWVSAADQSMYRQPTHASQLYRSFRAVRARFVLLPDARALDLAELFFAEQTDDRAHADALAERLTRVAPEDPRPAIERAAACLFPCAPGATADRERALALLQAAAATAAPDAAEEWELHERIARLERGEPWECLD